MSSYTFWTISLRSHFGSNTSTGEPYKKIAIGNSLNVNFIQSIVTCFDKIIKCILPMTIAKALVQRNQSNHLISIQWHGRLQSIILSHKVNSFL